VTAPEQVTPAQIEAKLREIQTEVDEGTDKAKGYAVVAGAVIVVTVLGVGFWLGRRRGRKKTTIVEIQRV
jgi:hypothetical protein